MSDPDHPLIEAPSLQTLLQAPDARSNIRILDCTCNTVVPGLTPYQTYQAKHIGPATFFDIDDVADINARLPHTVPDAETFARKVTDMGIGNKHRIIVYDQSGIAFAAARVWWLFRLFGHNNVQILNGGLPAWEAEGYDCVQGTQSNDTSPPFQSHIRPHLVKFIDDVFKETGRDECLILDARAPERFSGQAVESRDFVESGHIPSSRNMFYKDLIDPATGKMKPAEDLKRTLAPFLGHKTVTCSCGGGVTACILALGLFIAGYKDASIYDGSWAEWGNEANNMPVSRQT